MSVKFKCVLADSREVIGPIQGHGGYLGDSATNLPRRDQENYAHELLLSAVRIFEKFGRQRVVFEPELGCCAVFPDDSPESRGEAVVVPIIGTHFEVFRARSQGNRHGSK